MKKKVLFVVFAALFMSLFGFVSAQAITQTEAVNWAKAQIGTKYQDSGNGGQCTDFVSAYMN